MEMKALSWMKDNSNLLWECAGMVAGLVACLSIGQQALQEWRSTTPSTLSLGYTLGFLAIFTFWALYGFRFKRTALWATNTPAVILQIALIIISVSK